MRTGVLLMGNHPPPFGGVPTHIVALASHLAPRGWDVHVLSLAPSSGSGEYLNGYTVHRPTRSDRWRTLLSTRGLGLGRAAVRYALQSPRHFLGTVALARFIDRLVQRYDIRVISAYHLLPAALAASWVCRERKLPLVTTVFGEIYAEPAMHARRRAELQFVLDVSSHLLSCSRHCAASFSAVGLSPRVEVLYYGVDTQRFSPHADGPGVRARHGVPSDAPVVLFVGRMVRDMGLHTLLEALPAVWAAIPQAHALVVGTAGPLLDDARLLARRHAGRVVVAPDVPDADLPGYYAAATVVVAPSTNARACFGLAIAEGMACGKPVVASDVGGTREVVVPERTGILVAPERADELAQAVIRLLRDPSTAAALGREGRVVVSERFPEERTLTRMREILEGLVAAP